MGEYLAHSKGKWKKHKYVRKEGNRYIYPEDLAKGAKKLGRKIDNTKLYEDFRVSQGEKVLDRHYYRVKDLRRDVGRGAKKTVKNVKKAASNPYDTLGGKYKKAAKRDAARAEKYQKQERKYRNRARRAEEAMIRQRGKAHEQSFKVKLSNSKKAMRAEQKVLNSKAKSNLNRSRYENSVAGRYDSAKRSAKRVARKIDNTRLGTSRLTVRYSDNSTKSWTSPYRVKDLRKNVTQSVKSYIKKRTKRKKRKSTATTHIVNAYPSK